MLERKWEFIIVAALAAAVTISGCAKRAVVKDETVPQNQAVSEAKPEVKAPPAKADWEKKWEAMEKARKEKEALAKKNAKPQTSAVASAKEVFEFKDIHFDFDKYNLQDEARAVLDKDAQWLNQNKGAQIKIEGNCDERGTAEYNLALGERRANVAAKYLTDMGIDAKRMKTVSYGFERPLDTGHNEEAWAKNRRDHFVVSGK